MFKNAYEGEKKDLFDDFFCVEALNELTQFQKMILIILKILFDKYI